MGWFLVANLLVIVRQIIGIILVNLDWRYIQNVLTVFDSWGPLLKETDWCHLVTFGHLKEFNVASKKATKNIPVTNLVITAKCLIFAHFITCKCYRRWLSLWGILLELRQFTDRHGFWRQFTNRTEDSSPTLLKTVHRQNFILYLYSGSWKNVLIFTIKWNNIIWTREKKIICIFFRTNLHIFWNSSPTLLKTVHRQNFI